MLSFYKDGAVMAVPLDKKFVSPPNAEGARMKKQPALHPCWKLEVQFVSYLPPPPAGSDGAAMEEWTERMTFLTEDLHWLLALPHDKFWSQVVFDETLQRAVDSYLRYAPRCYDMFDLSDSALEQQNQVHRLIFMVCLRMSTHKEDKDNFITPKVFGDILYENFIFDIPKLMDLCVLYGENNGPLLSKMIDNVFTNQPNYNDDLAECVPTVLQVLQSIVIKCGIKLESGGMSPQKLSDSSSRSSPLLTMPSAELQDIILYLADTSATLCSFLDVFPAAASAFKVDEFPISLAAAYETLVPVIEEALKKRDWTDLADLRWLLKRKLRQAQKGLLKSFRAIIFQAYLSPVLEHTEAEEVEPFVEDYLILMSSLLSERRFLAHHEYLFPFGEDCDLLSQSAYAVDDTRLQFIQEAITSSCDVVFTVKKSSSKSKPLPVGYGEGGTHGSDSYQLEEEGALVGGDKGACAPHITGVQLESLISSVKDLLPDLGEGFIQLCLEEFNYNVEEVINAVLEDKLPVALQTVDRTLPKQEPEETEDNPSNLVDERRNVFDNDEFDVFHRDKIDTSKIHQGKKDKTVPSVLDDKSAVDDLRPLYSAYGSQFVESMYDNIDEYEDEYDDTYDSNQIGADDADSADELTTKKQFSIVPQHLGSEREGSAGRKQEEVDSQEEDDGVYRDRFVEDPAKIRERQAQRYASQTQHQKKKPPAGQGPRNYDVKGKDKGQGQESDVLKNRAYKEKNKSTRVHHNRKALSDKKRRI